MELAASGNAASLAAPVAPGRIRVAIIDDEFLLRTAWQRIVASQPDMELVLSLGSANELLSAARASSPDVLLVDLRMPGRDTFEALSELTAQLPAVRAIIFSGSSDRADFTRARDAGAYGFVDKLTPPSDILSLIRSVSRGERHFPTG